MKAIVMETRDKKAAILLKDGTFRTVKGRYSVGETIDYQETIRPAFRKWIAAAAAAVIMIGTGGGFWYDANYVAYAEISLDVNPSIVYTVNKRSRVLSVRAVNAEAAETVSTLEEEGIRFMPVAEAIDKTMALFENEGYLDAEHEDYVLMNVSADNADVQESVTAEIETGMGRAMERDPSMEYRVDQSDRATARRAEDSDMSTGRYAVWEQEGGDRKPEEYAEMTVRELMGKPDETAPAGRPEEDSAPQDEKDTPAVPTGEMQEQDPPAHPGYQPAESPESGDNFNRPNESAAPFGEPDNGEQQPASPESNSVESPNPGVQLPTGAHTGADPRSLQEEGPQSMQQDWGMQNITPPPNRDTQGNDMSRNAPGNAPGGPENQPPK